MHHRTLLAVSVFAFVGIGILALGVEHPDSRSGEFFMAQVGGAVGISVGVLPNEFNAWAAELKKKEALLADREQNIEERETAMRASILREEMSYYVATRVFLSGIGALLIGLIFFKLRSDRRRKAELVRA